MPNSSAATGEEARKVDNAVRQAVEFLRRQPGVRRVWLFGSAAKGRNLDFRSDLDLAVEGLAADALPRTWSELDAQLPWPLDLVRWESASEGLREQVLAWGKLVHEA